MARSTLTIKTTPTYDNEALAAAIRDIFPKMPEQEVAGVISHAFTAAGEKGKKARVGKAADLSLPRRIQLAVGAHIRHNFTEYDTFLKTLKVNNHEDRDWIRAVVEPTMVSKIREWRGEEDAELESSFREVIVIDDDDDEAGPAQDPPRDSPSSRQYTLTRPAPTQRSPPVHESCNTMLNTATRLTMSMITDPCGSSNLLSPLLETFPDILRPSVDVV
ncbi:hypothetical protein P154DRAFT_526798 [Amniculicola lignicola CBS 123094]|uniref:DUF2293 domain-containing protein n=1 Tax=Amniculicola lignicola CBS 123094 TaxID=1392246 RepID=A0A6A5W0R9_9PLEO|nr:hypothetical protein P154DRAFT_526798 [Amniculicola lignicola CBS 123094]